MMCVWCWHKIMNMAEKDESEGRCPACRTPYNKEKIVGTTASCERLVPEMNVEKKAKSSWGKIKPSEGRKQLASVRVIQRNLVYVVGLPLNMADEDLLQCRDYFGQYGKVLKVSISRTASGAIQHFVNSTCSVYITYSKEEEAVLCIKSVHGFFLDGKPLRACFGTTKYCHAWLRNAPCSNPDCLYLHEIGSQEDSFTKDEMISAYTRVQQITGSTNSTQRRSGYVLPPPADDYCNNTSASSGKPINKTFVNTNNTQISARVSPPNSSSGRSAALPAGASRIQCSDGLLKKPDVSDGLVACSTAAVSQMQQPLLHSDNAKILVTDNDNLVSQDKSETETSGTLVKVSNTDEKTTLSRSPNTSVHPTTLPVNKQSLDPSPTQLAAVSTNDVNPSLVSDGFSLDRDAIDTTNGKMKKMTHSHFMPSSIQEIQIVNGSQTFETNATTNKDLDSRDAQSDCRMTAPRSRTPSPAKQFDLCDIEDDLLSFENQRLKDPEVSPKTKNSFYDSQHSSHYDVNSTQYSNADASIGSRLDRQVVDKFCNTPIGHSENIIKAPEVNNAKYSNSFPAEDKRSVAGRYDAEQSTDSFNTGESSIISNILSIDFHPWDESLTSPQNLAKFLGENEQKGPFGVPGSRKNHTSNQSRFSFAREEEPKSETSGFRKCVDYLTKGPNQHSFGHEYSNGSSLQLEKLHNRNGLLFLNGMESKIFTGNHSLTSSNRLSVSRPQVSSPPGFSVPLKTPPPPGFTSHGNHLLDVNSMLRHNYQTSSASNALINGDIEFIDPAILAVGKGLLPGSVNSSGLDDLRIHYPSQFNTYEEAKYQSILQRPLPSHQNQRFAILGESFSPLGDNYSIPSRVLEQTLASNMSPLSQFTVPHLRNGIICNGQWDERQAGNNLDMAELLKNERLGFNKYYGGYEDSKIRMPSSGNLFNGTYGI